MMHISEFSRQSGIRPQTLRRYHAQGLLVPEVDPHTGYRWYSSSQLHTARFIQSLRGAGCNVALIRAMLHPSDVPDLLGQLEAHALTLRSQATHQQSLAMTIEGFLRHCKDAALPGVHELWNSLWFTPADARLRVAFVGLKGGVGRTTNAIYTATLLQALGRNVAVVDVSGHGDGALTWARQASQRDKPLPFPVYTLRQYPDIAKDADVIFDSTPRVEDFTAAALLADRLVLCVDSGGLMHHTLQLELSLLQRLGVGCSGSAFGVLLTGAADPLTPLEPSEELTAQEVRDWREEWKQMQQLVAELLQELSAMNLPVLGVIPHREVHMAAGFTCPQFLQDHHRVLGRFLGVDHLMPSHRSPSTLSP